MDTHTHTHTNLVLLSEIALVLLSLCCLSLQLLQPGLQLPQAPTLLSLGGPRQPGRETERKKWREGRRVGREGEREFRGWEDEERTEILSNGKNGERESRKKGKQQEGIKFGRANEVVKNKGGRMSVGQRGSTHSDWKIWEKKKER